MAIKPFEIQSSTLTIGGVDLQAGTTSVVIPGVTQAVNYFVEEVDEADGVNPDTFGSDTEAVLLLDNAAYLFRSGAETPSGSYSEAGYSVQELDDGAIEEIYVEVAGVFTSADKAFAEAGNMWASTVADAKTKPVFDANDWTQIAFRPRMRAGEVETIGGGNANTGNVVFEDNTLYVGGTGFLNLENDDGQAVIGTNGPDPLLVSINEGDVVWTFSQDGRLYLPGGEPSIYSSDNADITLSTPGTITLNNTGGTWDFNSNGDLILPEGGDIKDSDGNSVLGSGGGSTTTTDLWIAGGESPGGAAIRTSTNGTTWTTQDYLMGSQYIKRVAIGANKIVYLINLDGQPGDAIYYTVAPENGPALAVGTDSYGEGAPVYWEEINYLGNKFVAVGSYASNGNTVSTTVTGLSLAGGGRTYPRIGLSNIDYNFDGASITITGSTNTELNGTFILQYNTGDDLRTGVYDLTLDGGGVPTLTSTVITGATVNDLTNVGGSLPIFAYSTDGVSWTYGDIDPGYFMEVGGATLQLEMSDVAYDGTGYLIPVLANGFFNENPDDDPYAYGPGAFYITDLTAQVSSGQWIEGSGPNSLPGNGNNIASYGDGTFFVSDDQYMVWTGNPTDGWANHDIRQTLIDAYGWDPLDPSTDGNDIDSAVAGSVGLNQCFVATTNEGMVISTTDQGSTFQVSIPDPITGTATLHQVDPVMLDFNGSTTPYQWEKITIAVAQGDDTSWNGTYYLGLDNGTIWVLYDAPEGTAISGTTWTTPSNPFNITYGRGVDLDSIAVGDNACIVYSGNSNKLYRSTDLTTWTVVSNEGNYYVNDIYYSSITTASTSQLSNGDYTLALNDDGGVKFPDGSVQTTAYTAVAPAPYKGFKVQYARMYDSEPTISKLVIYQDTNDTVTSEVDTDTSSDLFKVTGLDNSGIIAMINVFGNDSNIPVPLPYLKTFAEAVIDNVMLNGGIEGDFKTAEGMRDAFYNSFTNFSGLAGARYSNFEFYKVRWQGLSGTTRQGNSATFDVVANDGDPGVYTVSVANGGFDYRPGHRIKILGTSLGGATPANDLSIYVDSITDEIDGTISAVLTLAGTSAGSDPTNYNGVSGTNYNVGSGALIDIRREYEDGTPINDGVNDPGSNYQIGDVVTILGTSVGGATPDNNITVIVTATGGGGGIDGYTVSGTLPTTADPGKSIYDGGSDQYDTANYIFTDLQGDSRASEEPGVNDGDWALPYNLNTVTTGTAFFGSGSEYVVTYDDSIFGLFVTGANINWIGTNGNSGFDGDGIADTGSLYQVPSLGDLSFGKEMFRNWQDNTETGLTLRLGNNPAEQVLITGPTPNSNYPDARRLVIQGQQGFGGEGNSKGEGGDVYIWAGSGGDEGSSNPRGDGGDVKLRGGYGGLNGGYIRLEAGDALAENGTGGFLELHAGDSSATNSTGGYVQIRSGGGLQEGGDVNIIAGVGGTNNGNVRVNVSNGDYQWVFRNDGVLEGISGNHIGAELLGDDYAEGSGYQYTITVDFYGTQNGDASDLTGVAIADTYSVAVGDTITFRNGEVRTVATITADSPDPGAQLVEWSGDTVASSLVNPAYPITIASTDYVAYTKPTARIKPDNNYVGLGQYVDIYTGGAPSSMDDLGHIHMKGHTGNVELFLGTDDNFVSTKEAGTTPGHVTMRSETEIKVIETDIRTTRNGSTFVGSYGDGVNYNWNRTSANDITHNCVTTDPDGNYYIGGEHTWNADAMISKFSKDGELVWTKLVESEAWDVKAIAYDPVNNRVGAAFSSNLGRTNDYIKLVAFAADTGEEVGTQDYYDADGGLYATDMAYDPTLGWVIAATSYGEEVVLSGLSPQTGSGVGRLVLDKESTRILGDLMAVGNTSWKVSGDNITGKQTIDSAVGLFRLQNPVNVTVANPAAAGLSVDVRIDYTTGMFTTFAAINAVGADYTAGDQVKVPGSLLGGIDGGTNITATPILGTVNGSQVDYIFPKPDYPNLYNQLKWASFIAQYNTNSYNVLSIVSEGNSWIVSVDTTDNNGGTPPTITFYTAEGNDVTYTLEVDGLGGVTGAGAITGNPHLTNITIDMATLAYPAVNFSTGTYTISRLVDGRPVVITPSWKRFLDLEDDNAYSYGYSTTVTTDAAGNVYLGGYVQSSINFGNGGGFVWKLNASGVTQWAKGLPAPWQVESIAVNAASTYIYVVARGMGVDLYKLDAAGDIMISKYANGVHGGRPHGRMGRDETGVEHLYIGWGEFSSPLVPDQGFAVQKIDADLNNVWARYMGFANGGGSLRTDYDNNYQHFAISATQATVVGYGNVLNAEQYTDALIASISITDDFEVITNGPNGFTTLVLDLTWATNTELTTTNLIALGMAGVASTVESASGTSLDWLGHRFQNRIISGNVDVQGLVGIENIKFINGGDLDHNPSDIPQSNQNLQLNDQLNWNITLTPGDRGKFIKNKHSPDYGNVANLTVYVPQSSEEFPVGSIITLINLDNSNTYTIRVEPVGYFEGPNYSRVWVAGQTNNSVWSFKGIQTATLMKVSPDDWILTANDVVNED